MPVIVGRAIGAYKGFKAERLRVQILSLLHRYERLLKQDLESTVSAFRDGADQASFETEISFRRSGGGDAVVMAGPVMNGSHGAKVWMWLDQGTKERWAYMNKDYQPGTARGQIQSTTPEGWVEIRGKGLMQRLGMPAAPGIQARDFVGSISKLRGPQFQSDVADWVSRVMEF